MNVQKKIQEQLGELRQEYETHARNVNELWPGMGQVPTDEQIICMALETELRSIRKVNRRFRGRDLDKHGITDFSGMVKAEEIRLGVGNEELKKRHFEIMDLVNRAAGKAKEKRATDQSRRADK